MDSEVLYMSTIYTADGSRVGLEIDSNKEKITERAPDMAKRLGAGYTFKLWECKEIPAKQGGK